MSFVNTSTTVQHIRDRKLRAIAVAESARIAALPDVPTVAESGVPGFEATSWFGIGTRAGTPRAIIDRLSDAAVRAVAKPNVTARLSKLGIEARPMRADQFAKFVNAESVRWGANIRRTGAQAN